MSRYILVVVLFAVVSSLMLVLLAGCSDHVADVGGGRDNGDGSITVGGCVETQR